MKPSVEDINELSDVIPRAFKDDIPHYGEIPQEIAAPESHEAMMNEKVTGYYGALYENKIFGGIVIQDKGNNTYRLALIYVDYEYQRKGIGTQLYKFVEAKCINAKKWVVETPSLNIKDQKFYEKMGYKKTGEYQVNSRMTAWQYEKILG